MQLPNYWELPQLDADKIILFIIEDDSRINQPLLDFYFQWLSAEEQTKAKRFVFPKDQRLYILAHALLRYVLGFYLDKKEQDIQFITNDKGKPSIKNNRLLQFNLSHSTHAAVVAVGLNTPLGVDIEHNIANRIDLDLANHYFTPSECQQIHIEEPQQQYQPFFQLWTLKEAYIKAIGTGLSTPLDSFSINLSTLAIHLHQSTASYSTEDWFFYQSYYANYVFALASPLAQRFSDIQVETYYLLPRHDLDLL